MSDANMPLHDHIDDAALADFLIGALPADAETRMREHLATCAVCRRDFGDLFAVRAALAYGAPEPDVEIRSDAMWDAIAASLPATGTSTAPPVAPASAPLPIDTASTQPTPIGRARPRRSIPWMLLVAVAAIALIAGGLIGRYAPFLQEEEEPTAQTYTVSTADGSALDNATLRYLPDEQVFVFDATSLPALKEGQVYQAWLIPGGGEPVSAGVMNASSGEMASAGTPDQYSTFAITVEPGPVGSGGPTSDPLFISDLTKPINP